MVKQFARVRSGNCRVYKGLALKVWEEEEQDDFDVHTSEDEKSM
jgi:hypothetical protein